MWCQDVPVPKRRVSHILKSEKITSLSQVLNLAAFLKNLSEEGAPMTDKIKNCTDQLEELLPTLDEKFQARVSFIMEQLLLSTKEPRQRRYSSFLLATTATWLTTSTATYKQMLRDDVLCLPSISHLKRLLSAMTLETGLTSSTISYLSTRFKKLEERERIVSVIGDEIYTAKRAEFSGGTFYGYELGEPTKTML